MGLSAWLARRAVAGAHVLLVEAPGGWLVRVRAEQALRRRGWHVALSPADADVLLVCGTPGSRLSSAVELVWDQLPGPRSRIDVASELGVDDALDRARRRLLDDAWQRRDATARAVTPQLDSGDHGDMDHGDMDHDDMDHDDMDMAPGGLPLAEGADDRDGLEMDVLNVRLGPVLPAWPAGLVLRCTLHGDVIASAEVVDGTPGEAHDVAPPAEQLPAWRCDRMADLMALAGWDAGAARARRVRDLELAGETETARQERETLVRQVRRSRALRWSLRRLGPLTAAETDRLGLSRRYSGDAHDRVLAWLDAPEHTEGAAPASSGGAPDPHTLAGLVTGLDLAAARLVVASLTLDPLAPSPEVQHA
jgi:hypothetical protein